MDETGDAPESTQPLLDTETRRRLVALKGFLREALGRSHDTDQLGRHIALVLLDGACERAMAHAAHHLGLPVQDKPIFTDMAKALGSRLGATWHGGSWTGVQALHRMRNQAQHVGGIADIDQIQGWAADTEAFVSTLVERVFSLPLEQVTLAEAVKDESLRAALLQAERALADNDPGNCFEYSRRAFAAASKQWRNQASPDHWGSHDFGSSVPDEDARALAAQASDLVLNFSFATEPAEYVWFRELQEAVRQGAPPDLDDASRALSFAFTWILRWESFNQRHDPHRTRRWRESLRPPVIEGLEGWQLVFESVEANWRRFNDDAGPGKLLATVTVQLTNVDAPDLDQSIQDLLTRLRESWAEAGFDRYYFDMRRDGRLRIFDLPADVDTDLVVTLLQGAIQQTQEATQAEQERQAAWQQRLSGLLAPYQTALSEIRVAGNPAFVGYFAHPEADWPTDPRAFTIHATSADDTDSRHQLLTATLQTARSQGVSVNISGTNLVIDGHLDPDIVQRLLREASQRVTSEHEAAHELEEQRRRAESEFHNRFRQSLSRRTQPGTGSPRNS